MPEMTLTSVDLPAPLSPTRPTTSPGMTRKSTPFSARTAPNRLVIPRSSSRGGGLCHLGQLPFSYFWLLDAGRLAGGSVLADTDLRGLPEAVGDDRVLDVVLRHRDRPEQDRRDVDRAVVGLAVDDTGGGLGALQQVHGELRGGLGLRLDRL